MSRASPWRSTAAVSIFIPKTFFENVSDTVAPITVFMPGTAIKTSLPKSVDSREKVSVMGMVSLDFYSTTGGKFGIRALNKPIELSIATWHRPGY